MKKLLIAAAALCVAALLLAGCHNTGRQIRKAVDGAHDILLEGSH